MSSFVSACIPAHTYMLHTCECVYTTCTYVKTNKQKNPNETNLLSYLLLLSGQSVQVLASDSNLLSGDIDKEHVRDQNQIASLGT